MYGPLAKLMSEAMQSWGKTARFCLIVAVVAATVIITTALL